jgi:probable O-glycosylation ligase (exosortase A-associated)
MGFVVIASIGAVLVAFMPDHWSERMGTIKTYQEDMSAMLRISAWWTAWGVAQDFPLGVGFNADRPELFALYSPTPTLTTGPHSIYFQILGNHGFVGLFLYLGVLFSTLYQAGRLRKEAARLPQAQWCEQLASMCQVSLVGFMVGGTFLAMAYFDMPYNVMVMVVLARIWVRREAWKTEPETAPRWYRILGLTAQHRPA